jgi:ABC-type maltose transport system permease subunit
MVLQQGGKTADQIDEIRDYDSAREDSLGTMLKDFYNTQMLSVIVIVWAWAIVIIAAAVYSAVQFFQTEQTKSQIMYAAIFVCCVQFIALTKIFAWQMIHRNSIKRQIRRLEMAIARQRGRA